MMKKGKEKENQLAVILRESNLETTKVAVIFERFQGYFDMANEWEKKAKALVVTNESQTADMEMARVGRLFLKEKRVAVEKTRVTLKEQALREGKAIDGISNILKALIISIEEHLDKQEHFVEFKREEKREALRIEAEKKLQEEEDAKLKAEAEENARIRQENEKLRKENEKKERAKIAERKRHEAKLAEERAKAEKARRIIEEDAQKELDALEAERAKERAKAAAAREVIEKKLRVERAKAEEKARKERKRTAEIEAALKAGAEADRKVKEALAEQLKNQIECPFCHKKFQRGDK